MSDFERAFRSSRVLTPAGERPATVLVKDGRIARITDYHTNAVASEVIDLGNDALLPGLVDTHVHVNEPGRTETEGFATATRAAAAGGVTTIVDMPNGSIPPTTSVEALEIKRSAAVGQCYVDVGFWGGAVSGNQDKLIALHEAGVFGFKGYLTPESVSFPYLRPFELRQVLETLQGVDALLLVHSEDADVIAAAEAPAGTHFSRFAATRPPTAEVVAVTRLVEASRATGARVHVVHLSAADTLPVVQGAKRDGVRLTAETCPHYLAFRADDVPEGGTQFKCTPPIRGGDNRDMLWKALTDGLVDFVVSDHSPYTVSGKCLDTGDFDQAGAGISSLQLSLSVMWSEARKRGHQLADVVQWMATKPARVAGMVRKGAIVEGFDADLVWFDPDQKFTVDQTTLYHRNPVTAYEGKHLTGVVKGTWLRGTRVGGQPHGMLLKRGQT